MQNIKRQATRESNRGGGRWWNPFSRSSRSRLSRTSSLKSPPGTSSTTRLSNGIAETLSPSLAQEESFGSMASTASTVRPDAARMNTLQMEEGGIEHQSPEVPVEDRGIEHKKPQVPVEDRGFVKQLKTALCGSWINILLVFAPVGIATHYAGINPTIVFVMNFIAIVPLAALLSFGTEEIALYCGEVMGGLLNATFGNAVELIVSIFALISHEIVIVQTSLIGSILSNLLLVLGMAFIAGGCTRSEQNFNTTVASTAASLLTVACASLIVPTAFHMASSATDKGITELSRGTSIILLLVYGSYLLFQLKTHAHIYNEPSEKVPKRVRKSKKEQDTEPSNEPLATPEEEPEIPSLTPWAAIILLLCSTAVVAICAECLVSSIDHLVESSNISRVFIGLILLPIVGNAAEHATAVTVATKDKMDLSIGVAVGSSMQIALLVIPLIVVLGWCMGIDEMNLYFDGFQVMILFVSVLLVNYLIQDGKSNYLEGNLLISLYLIIALASWFYPADGVLAQTDPA